MSQTKMNQDNTSKSKNMKDFYGKHNFPRGIEREYKNSYKNFQYYSTKYNFHPHWSYRRRRPNHRYSYQKPKERSPSPFSGTEEYNLKKIQETSDMIKKRLLMPESEDPTNSPQSSLCEEQQTEIETKDNKNESEKTAVKANKKVMSYSDEEIQQKIITHISNLSHGKKMNLICANSSGYDVAIEQIHKQKRLELSKVFRDMCSNRTVENSEVMNTVIPDIGIKLEDLPLEVIEKLSNTLDLDLDYSDFLQYSETPVCVKTEVCENESGTPLPVVIEPTKVPVPLEENDFSCITQIKQESIDIKDVELIDSELQQIETQVEEVAGSYAAEIPIKKEVLPMDTSDSFIKTEDVAVDGGLITDNIQDTNEMYTNFQNYPVQRNFHFDFKTNISVSLQTDILKTESVQIQTDSDLNNCQFTEKAENVKSLDDAIAVMLKIDKEIMRLTELRQSVFNKIQKQQASPKKTKKSNNLLNATIKSKTKDSQPTMEEKNKEKKKRTSDKLDTDDCILIEDDLLEKERYYYKEPVVLESIPDQILVIKVVENTLLATSAKGNIYYINTINGRIDRIIRVPKLPVVSLCLWKSSRNKLHLLVGASDTKYEYHYETKELLRATKVKDTIQCLEVAWDYVFMGTVHGNLVRYSLKLSKIEFDENISPDNVMVLKATQEGARRVLLVGMRNAPVTVRDSMSGLHLRTMNELVTPTVYCLLLENSMVYCGTTNHDILVFSFHDGNLIHKHQATNSRGVSCLKIVDNLLFASCYNGSIYVYDIKTHAYIGSIEGPGGVILSMEVVKNIVIVGTMSLNFKAILIPSYILRYNKI